MTKRFPKPLLLVVALLIFAAPLCAQERKIKDKIPPAYPEMAKSMHLSGMVRIQVTISPQGAVKDTKILGGHPLLADAAVKAIQKWKYEPGPEETQIVQVEFKPHE